MIFLFFIRGNAQEVIDVYMGECDINAHPSYMYSERLISKKYSNDTLFLELGLIRNCSFKPDFNLTLSKDSLIFVINDTASIREMCNCCFELTLVIKTIPDTNLIFYEKYEVDEYEEDSFFKVYDVRTEYSEIKRYENNYFYPTPDLVFDSVCENQLVEDSLRVGYWCFYDEKTQLIKSKLYYSKPSNNSNWVWYVLYENGNPIQMCAIVNSYDTRRETFEQCISWKEYTEIFGVK